MRATTPTTIAEWNRIPREHERLPQREQQPAWRWCRPQHARPGEVLTRLRAKRDEIAVDATRQDDQRDRPRESADSERGDGPRHDPQHALAPLLEQGEREQRQRQTGGLHADAGGKAGDEGTDDERALVCRAL